MSFQRLSIAGCILVWCCVFPAPPLVRGANNWPQWRGPQGNGHCSEQDVPVTWDKSNVFWRTELPGLGHSSPVIWGDRIYLTSALDGGQQRVVLCLDRNDGKLVWQQVAWSGQPEKTHKMNMYASASCATDGEHVVAFFGRGGIHCYDPNGKNLWSHDLGTFDGSWGTAASPIILGRFVIQNCDAEGASYLVALDKQTGREHWRTSRPELPRGGWSTPIVIDTGKRHELVLNGEFGVHAYDGATGSEFWFCKGFNGRGEPMPVFAHGLLFLVNGKAGDVYAVRPGGTGDVTSTHMAWHTPRSGSRDLPSPILVGDFLFVVNMQGVGSCYDAISGKELWKSRIGGNFAASPIVAGGLIYALNEDGETIVIRPGKEMDIVARNTIGSRDDEIFRASLAVSDGQIFCRSDQVLYCIGKRR